MAFWSRSRLGEFKMDMGSVSEVWLLRDRLPAQNFEAVLGLVVNLAGDSIFRKFCQGA